MSDYENVISRAVDLVSRRLAGMDIETISRFTQILSQEAESISTDLRNSGEHVEPVILAARLDGLIARMRHELRDKGTDPSPYEFPIFNVSNDPVRASPYPVNLTYNTQFREAYPTAMKHSQALPINYDQKSKPVTSTNSKPTSKSHYFQQQQDIDWYVVKSPVNHYEQSKRVVEKQSTTTSSSRSQRPTTTVTSRSRSNKNNELQRSPNINTQKILVNVISDDFSSSSTRTSSQKQTPAPTRTRSQKSILKSNKTDNIKQVVMIDPVCTTPSTFIGEETMEDLFQTMKYPKPIPSQLKGSTEHLIVIDRNVPNSTTHKPTKSKKGRLRTSKTHIVAPNITDLLAATPSTGFGAQESIYYNTPPFVFEQTKTYTPISTTSYSSNAHNYYPYLYYQY